MKKALMFFLVFTVALCLSVPAMALKLETKGYMDVTGIVMKNFPVNTAAQEYDSTSAWYQQEMIIEPTLHVNEWVRIHNKITIMERYWNGGHGAEYDNNNFLAAANRGGNYRSEHNFWWEQMYVSFPLFGGHLYVGRQPGGSWGYPFQDSTSNRDRIKWVGKVMGKYTVAIGNEKLREGDAGVPMVGPYNAGGPWVAQSAAYTNSASDQDAYYLGFVLPITKEFLYRPLFYYITDQEAGATQALDYLFLFCNAITYTSGPLKVDAEINYIKSPLKPTPTTKVSRDQFAGWMDLSYKTGPYEFAFGGFYVQGNNANNATAKRKSIVGTGEDFEPLFVTFSEDVGCLWNTTGVANGSVGGASGYVVPYLRGGYKISNDMALTAKLAYLLADKMVTQNTSDKLGWEFDLGYQFKFMKNIKYVLDAGVFFPGQYWDDSDGVAGKDLSNNVYGVRHMLVIEW